MNEIAEEITRIIDVKTKTLSREDYKAVLEDLFLEVETRMDGLADDIISDESEEEKGT